MAAAKHIGRVGALAVALGVGMAVAGTSGVAAAETARPDSSTTSTKDTSSAGAASDDDSSSSAKDTPSSTKSNDDDDEGSAPSEDTPSSNSDADDTSDDDAPDDDTTTDDTSPDDQASDDDDTAPEPPVPAEEDISGNTETPVTTAHDPEPAPTAEAAATPTRANSGAPKAAAHTAQSISTPVSTPVTQVAGAEPADGPARPSLLLAVVGWLRREYEYSVLGQKPTILPSQIIAESTGNRPVHGTLNAYGPNSQLVYELTGQPAGGIVILGDDGQWTYTPGGGFSTEGGTDSFTVKVTDRAFHLEHLFGAPVYTRSVTVAVAVPEKLLSTGATAVYNVNNLTQNPLTVHYSGDVPFDIIYPLDGTVFQPGEAAQFQISGPKRDPLVVDFHAATGQKFQVIMWNAPVPVTTSGFMSYIACSGSGGAGTCTNPANFGTQAILVDAPGTQVTVTDANPAMVNAILNNICGNNPEACKFKPTKREDGLYGLAHAPTGFIAIENRTLDTLTTTYTMSDAVASQSSWSVTAKATAKIFEIISLEISSTYGQSVTNTHTYSQAIPMTIRPNYRGTLTVQAPVVRYTGDFTVRIGNTTWFLPNASIDIPDATRPAIAVARTEPIPGLTEL